jgi:hypothetical protein
LQPVRQNLQHASNGVCQETQRKKRDCMHRL